MRNLVLIDESNDSMRYYSSKYITYTTKQFKNALKTTRLRQLKQCLFNNVNKIHKAIWGY